MNLRVLLTSMSIVGAVFAMFWIGVGFVFGASKTTLVGLGLIAFAGGCALVGAGLADSEKRQ